MLVSYAQNFEDVLLWRALKSVEQGTYIDVGAQDPLIDSVSRLFYEQGWRGFHVEATATYANMLREARPDEVVLQVAVSDARGTMAFFEIPKTGISTGDPNIAADHRARGFSVVETVVPTLLLQDIFDHVHGEVHWLKIDVEGMERQVLAGWGDAAVRPWVVCVESTLPLTQTENSESWEAFLVARGYEFVYFDGLNRYYISPFKPELRASFENGPNLFDGFTLSGTQTSSFCHLLLERQGLEREEARTHIEALNQRINDLVATSLKVADPFFNARIEALRSEARRREDDWQKKEEALHRSVAQLNVQILEMQRDVRTSEKEAFANILSLKGEVRAAEIAGESQQLLFASDMRALETQIADLGHELEHSRLDAEVLRGQLDSESRESEALQRELTEVQVNLADTSSAFSALSGERVELIAAQSALRVELERRTAKYQFELQATQSAMRAELEHKAADYQALQTEAEKIRQSLNDETQKLTDATLRLSLAQNYIMALRSSTSWRVTRPLRRIKVFFGGRADGSPDIRSDLEKTNDVEVKIDSNKLSQNYSTSVISVGSDYSAMAIDMNTDTKATFPAHSLSELVEYCDEAFVICAYATLLGRSPDPLGMVHYLGRVRSGDSKHHIVWELSQSGEARQYGAKLPGLITRRSRARRLAALFRRAIERFTGQAAQQRAWRVAENQASRHAQIVLSEIRTLGAQFAGIDAATRNSLDMLDRRLVALQGELENRHEDVMDILSGNNQFGLNREDRAAISKLNGRAGGVYKRLRMKMATAVR